MSKLLILIITLTLIFFFIPSVQSPWIEAINDLEILDLRDPNGNYYWSIGGSSGQRYDNDEIVIWSEDNPNLGAFGLTHFSYSIPLCSFYLDPTCYSPLEKSGEIDIFDIRKVAKAFNSAAEDDPDTP